MIVREKSVEKGKSLEMTMLDHTEGVRGHIPTETSGGSL